MKKFSVFLYILIGFIPISNAQKSINYDDLIRKLATDFETPGIAVSLMDDFEFKEFTYGFSNIESQIPLTNKTLFNVASISKLVTAHAIMLLVEQGKIDLENPIENYLTSWKFPNGSYNSKLVTTRLVLNHSAGLSSEFGPGFTKNDSMLSLVEILSGKSDKRQPLRIVSIPGERHIYSNLGFGLLQLLIQDVTGKPYEVYVTENVLNKLNMTSSNFKDPLLLDPSYDLATPYDYRMFPLEQERFIVIAAAGLVSNLQDMEQLLLEETKNQKLLNKSSFNEMHSSDLKQSYGLGHMIHKNENEVAFVGHTGLGMGWNSSFQFIPGSDNGIVILTNGDNGYYIHNTLTCAWYYSQSGKRIESCKVGPDKKLNGIGMFIEIGYKKGLIDKVKLAEFEFSLSKSRESLKNGKFEKFIAELSELQSKLKSSMNDPEIQSNLDKAFEATYYWLEMPWFKN